MKRVLSAAMLFALAACSGALPVLTARLETAPPEPGYTLGGSVDSVKTDPEAGTVTIIGWHMLTHKTRNHVITVYAPGAQDVVSIERQERPDVVRAVDDKDLQMSGFKLVLKLESIVPLSELCMSFTDKHYKYRLMSPNTGDQVRCYSAGQ
jgi:hypothetical protein